MPDTMALRRIAFIVFAQRIGLSLERLRAGLAQCIGCGCLSLQQCRLANPGDTVGRTGPGPRFWLPGLERPGSDR